MKKFLLSVTACLACMTLQAQYNVFSSADIDQNGWLWFDTQAKIDKYIGYEGSGKPIEMISADYEPFDDNEFSASLVGAGTDAEIGGTDAKTGGIMLLAAQTSSSQDGGGLYIKVSDCSELSFFLSSEGRMAPGIYRGEWSDYLIDFALVRGWLPTAWTQLHAAGQHTWSNLQSLSNANTDATIGTTGKSAVYIKNQSTAPLFVHGIKLTSSVPSVVETAAVADKLISFDGTTVRSAREAVITVYDLKGALVASKTASELSLQGLASGIYIVKAKDGKACEVQKVVVQ